MVVEWGRSAYSSNWHLFHDSPSTKTAGRYYFSRPGTPHAPGPHFLGSRNWNDANHPHVQGRGESLTAKHEWDAGYEPPLLPFNRGVGPKDCLKVGSSITQALLPGEIVDGFAKLCFAPCGEREEPMQNGFDFDRCQVQKFYAKVIERMYGDDGATVGAMFFQLLGPDVTVKFYEAVGLMPAVTTVISPTLTIIVMDGTRTFQQLAVQGLTSLQSPTPVGGFGTVPLWHQASQWAHTKSSNDGQVPGSPVMIVGHSYGGAAALVLAARYRFWNPARKIRFLTFGCPKPGDQALANLIATCEGMNLANDNDLIPVFPPDFTTLFPVMLALGAPALAVWKNWIRPVNQVKLDANGNLDPNNLPQTDFDTLEAIAIRVLANLDLNPIVGHPIEEYIARLTIRCPVDAWPMLEPCVPVPRAVGGIVVSWALPMVAPVVLAGGEVPADGSGVVLAGARTPDGSVEIAGVRTAGGSVEIAGEVPAPGSVDIGGELPAIGDSVEIAGELPAGESLEIEGDIVFEPPQPDLGSVVLAGEIVTALPTGAVVQSHESTGKADGLRVAGDVLLPASIDLTCEPVSNGDIALTEEFVVPWADGGVKLGATGVAADGVRISASEPTTTTPLAIGDPLLGPAEGSVVIADPGTPNEGIVLKRLVEHELLFDVPGAYSWDAEAETVVIALQGGGGGGGQAGGGGGGDPRTGTGGGGGGGAWAEITVTGLTIGNTYAVLVGDGGDQNSDGADSYFDDVTVALATGGKRGRGSISGHPDETGAGGAGGQAADCIGDLAQSGGTGGAGFLTDITVDGGGGGGGAGSTADGTNGTDWNAGGAGGAGGGGVDPGGNGGDWRSSGSTNTAQAPGGGGGGGGDGLGTEGGTSYPGQAGYVRLRWTT